MTVRLFGHDLEITGSFLLSALLIAYVSGAKTPVDFVLWFLVIFVSVLIHELGHAMAFRLFGVRSAIRLHFMGGATMPSSVLPLSRPKLVFISFAGPLAGLVLAGVVYAVLRSGVAMSAGASDALFLLLAVNMYWSVFNLVPVLPLDGGHILQHALGPRRLRVTLGVSAAAGVLLAIWFLTRGQFFGAMILGSAAIQSIVRLREITTMLEESGVAAAQRPDTESLVAPPIAKELRDAKLLLDAEDPVAAIAKARPIAEGRPFAGIRPSPRAVVEALTLCAWAELAKGDIQAVRAILGRVGRITTPDPALLGALALAEGDPGRARVVLELARAQGDNRKEVFGPLIQALLGVGEAARAGALALDCADQISTADLRTLGGILLDANVPHWAGRLFESAFMRDKEGGDAFDAARSFARAGDEGRAVDLLKRALTAGFDDAGRIREDAALGKIDEVSHLIPGAS
jgi:Zn-dependent protease